ncbi:hypothetical protein RAB80_017032 [Fusarium oxysporum f. sp. vasinfectum]|nr:hypothetical protein RAB80_017032 [Fusarium oxysporum f. sp. vasinfectum]
MALELICAGSIPAGTLLPSSNNLSVGQNSGQNHMAHQGEMSSDVNNHGSPADEQLEFENSSQFTRGLHDQPEWLHDKSSHDRMKSIKSDIQSVPKRLLEKKKSPRALRKKPQPAPAPHQTTGRTSLNNNKIEKMSALAKREITRLELAQERAHLQAANHERAAAMAAGVAEAAAANISGMAVNGRRQLHGRDAGVKYERKTLGPFPGKLVSQGTIISIDGEDYVEYRVLGKPFPL